MWDLQPPRHIPTLPHNGREGGRLARRFRDMSDVVALRKIKSLFAVSGHRAVFVSPRLFGSRRRRDTVIAQSRPAGNEC